MRNMEKKLETRMMTDKVVPREVKEKQDEDKKQRENIVFQNLFGRTCYDENDTQSFNPNRY